MNPENPHNHPKHTDPELRNLRRAAAHCMKDYRELIYFRNPIMKNAAVQYKDTYTRLRQRIDRREAELNPHPKEP